MIFDPKVTFARSSTGLPDVQPPQQPPAVHDSVTTPRSVALLWLRRVGVLLFVFLCATIGVMLMIVPWRPEWTDNHLVSPYPVLLAIFSNGFTRGVCTGLGVLNVWIGFWEAI